MSWDATDEEMRAVLDRAHRDVDGKALCYMPDCSWQVKDGTWMGIEAQFVCRIGAVCGPATSGQGGHVMYALIAGMMTEPPSRSEIALLEASPEGAIP